MEHNGGALMAVFWFSPVRSLIPLGLCTSLRGTGQTGSMAAFVCISPARL